MCVRLNRTWTVAATAAENLRACADPTKVTMDRRKPWEDPMSYAEAKEIALLRLELRACWDKGDHAGAEQALQRLWQVVGSDSDLTAEARRWSVKLAS